MGKKHFQAGFIAMSFLVIFLLSSQAAAASDITKSLKATIDEVINIVTDESLKAKTDARRAKLREAISKRFNYHQMVMRSLAQDWPKRTPKEQEEFESLFRRLLENSYASKIES